MVSCCRGEGLVGWMEIRNLELDQLRDRRRGLTRGLWEMAEVGQVVESGI